MADDPALNGLGKDPSAFTKLAQVTARWTGKPATFFVAGAGYHPHLGRVGADF
jgi:hypothetical protein